MEGRESVFRVEGLRKLFGKKAAVADVSFSLKSGEVVGLLGPNGAGKTTVFYMLVGFIRCTGGRIFLDDQDITALPMHRRARKGISYLPQEASIFRKLTVEKNVTAVLETRRDLNRKERAQKLEELLTGLGIEGLRRQPAYTLSGGERRKAEIARALAINPKFLLLDEPFSGIDPIAVNEIKKIIQNLSSQGISILVTDHNVRDTLEITHRSYIINHGEIQASGALQDLLNNELAKQIYLGQDFRM
ncbi:MAG: LPS export ABC transporter ATP-binding protein [Spirochaetales bacterium]|jgi:lipopolysaccharide export system ATP-binding protein|nr:LPS export ABC transporter ATP-binding protein [Spirochaetales bacterium]